MISTFEYPIGVSGPLALPRIAIVSTQRRWHGGEVQAALLAEGLRNRGHHCLILARQGGSFAKRMRERGFSVVTFGGRGRLPAAQWKIRRALQRFRVDVLHYNDPHAMVAAGVASWGLQVPLRVASRRVDFPLKSVQLYRAFCDGLICVSRAVKTICQQGGYPEHRLHLVHDGVDPARMKVGKRSVGRRSLDLHAKQQLLLSVAKLTDHKGHRYLLEGMPRVFRKFPDAILALAGEGSLRQELEQQVDQLGLQDKVRFLGYRSDVPDLMAAADLFVVPSHMEGLCSSIIDAMLIGCPVVGTRAGGIPDLLEETTSQAELGWVVPSRDGVRLWKNWFI